MQNRMRYGSSKASRVYVHSRMQSDDIERAYVIAFDMKAEILEELPLVQQLAPHRWPMPGAVRAGAVGCD
jgi:hypothetical protein